MKDIIRKIYKEAPRDWDGDFLSLDDEIKDSSVRQYIFAKGLGSEVFPECCSGAEDILTSNLYTNHAKFYALYSVMVLHAGLDERFKSEAVDELEAAKLIAAYLADDALEVVSVFGDAAYQYCEDALREACFDEQQKKVA